MANDVRVRITQDELLQIIRQSCREKGYPISVVELTIRPTGCERYKMYDLEDGEQITIWAHVAKDTDNGEDSVQPNLP